MEKTIGEQGEDFNLSQASRSMNIEPDEEQIKKYDQYPDSGSFIKNIIIILLLGILGLTFYLFSNGRWILGIIGIIATLFLALLTFVFGSATKKAAYKNGLIVPAIIINTSPVEILAMADMRTTEEQAPIYGFLKKSINNLPNHKIEIDEKIPCVTLFGMGIKGYRRHFEPRPISWGFKDKSLIEQTIEVISNDGTESEFFKTEWEMLYKAKEKISGEPTLDTVVFFDADLNEVKL